MESKDLNIKEITSQETNSEELTTQVVSLDPIQAQHLETLVNNTTRTNNLIFWGLCIGGLIIIWHWIYIAFKDYFS